MPTANLNYLALTLSSLYVEGKCLDSLIGEGGNRDKSDTKGLRSLFFLIINSPYIMLSLTWGARREPTRPKKVQLPTPTDRITVGNSSLL
jgi:hypothetical protein